MLRVLTLRQWLSYLSIIGIISIISIFLSLIIGSNIYSPLEIIYTVVGKIAGYRISEITDIIIFQIRLPRVLLAVLVGGALSVTGGTFQALLKNPLADPYIMGISGGAALGVILSSFLKLNGGAYGLYLVHLFAFTGALVSVYVVYRLSRIRGSNPPGIMLLTGVMINAIIFAMILFLLSIVDSGQIYTVFYWLLGYLPSPTYSSLIMVSIFSFTGLTIIFAQARSINLLTMGDDCARALGVGVESVKRRLFIAGSLLVAVSVALCGPIGFLGIMVPHAVRMIVGYDYRILIPVSFIGGGTFLLMADTFARTIISPAEIPVGIITSIVGGPFFLYLLRRKGMHL